MFTVPGKRHLGRFRLGDTVGYQFLTRNSSGTPTAPDAHPSCKVYAPDETLIETVSAFYRGTVRNTGLFVLELFLDSDYDQYGTHDVAISYAISAANKGGHFSFEICRSGNASGPGISMGEYVSQSDKFVLVQNGDNVNEYANPKAL